MKNLNKIALTLLMTLMFATTGNIKANNPTIGSELNNYQTTLSDDFQDSFESSLLIDCKLTFQNDDGSSFEVTFHQISLYQCAKMKVGKWLKETF